ncbi:MAG: FtsX-like permease family protein [Bacillota bacterium]|nr:FtsX-like permease family protein [Bacillota bacterium]
MIRLALKMIRKDLKSSAFYFIVMTTTIAINFVFTATSNGKILTLDKVITDSRQLSTLYAAVPASDYLNMVIVAFCCFLMFYVNNNYIYNKKNEIAILSVSGASDFQIIIYFLMQTAFLFILSCIPGIFLGWIGVQFFFDFVSYALNTTIPPVDSTTITQSFILIGVILIYLVFYISAYVYKIDVKELLASRNTAKMVNRAKESKIPDFVYLLLYLGMIVLILLPNMPYENLSTQLFFGFVGLYGIINGVITRFVFKWKLKNSFKQKYKTISVSNYSSTILTSKLTILIMMFSIIMMFFVTLIYSEKVNELILSLAGYIIAVVLLSLTVSFDLVVQAKQRVVYYVNLWKIGYTRKQLKKIKNQEMFLFYTTILVLPLLMICPIGYRYVQARVFDQKLCVYMVSFFVGFVIISGILTSLIYGNIINKSIVGEK